MKFNSKSNSIVKKYLKQGNVQSPKRQIRNALQQKDVYLFGTQMQILFTKVGLILSECSEEKKLESGNSHDSLQYICNDVLEEPKLLDDILKTGINRAGNESKHELTDYRIDAWKCLKMYNVMIEKTVKKTRIRAFKGMMIKKEVSKKKKIFGAVIISLVLLALILIILKFAY